MGLFYPTHKKYAAPPNRKKKGKYHISSIHEARLVTYIPT
jgi:hypothetical protein